MKSLFLVLLACSVISCGHRAIPPEITALHVMPTKKILPQYRHEVIMIDAGHGGKDEGTSSKKDAYVEKELTLETAFMIADQLRQLGYKTIMTRKQDQFVALEKRAEMANAVDADLFVSIHYNFSVSKEAEGIEVFYYKENKTSPSPRIVESKSLANEVLKKIVKSTGAQSRGLKQANFAVIRETDMPAILVEAGFLSNPQERAKIRDPKYRQSLAKGIALGVDQYLTSQKKEVCKR